VITNAKQFSVWRLETLERSARPTTQRRLADALGIEPEDLVGIGGAK
jgi:hypothetical protein